MHRFISTDDGIQCFACGIVVDYPKDDPTAEDAAHSLAFGLCGRNDGRAHHYVLEGVPGGETYVLACAYDAVRVDAFTLPDQVVRECTGA